ncbi:MAG TPA: hypothetical protein VNX46_05530, partial [Candidatus Acidoferrum sp.]|nr:hypothetical protein [Candidatus Acidoferrum sp.]
TVAEATVGTPFTFGCYIEGDGSTGSGDAHPFVGYVNTAVASQTYITVLTKGAGYSSASGTSYPALQLPAPILTITPATNQTALVSWPSVYAGYVLQQNPVLTVTGWIQNSNTISAVNGTNQVTIDDATNSLYLRLAQP